MAPAPHAPFRAYDGLDPYLFASYAHADARVVFPEIHALTARGFRVWYDEGIEPGGDWPEEIAAALGMSEVLLVFLSPAAVKSRNVCNEINFAVAQGKPILAVHLEPTELPAGLEL